MGRIGRGRFWLGVLGILVAYLLASAVLGTAGLMTLDDAGQPSLGYALAIGLLALVMLWPTVCVYGKRFHDRDKSAWWILIALVPIVGGIWLLVECGLLQGTDGPNRYGPDPLAGPDRVG